MNKQIEEIAKIVCGEINGDCVAHCNLRGYCDKCNNIATAIFNADYRKREEIAKQYHDMLAEEDIECFNDGRDNAYLYTDHLLAINDKIYKELTK